MQWPVMLLTAESKTKSTFSIIFSFCIKGQDKASVHFMLNVCKKYFISHISTVIYYNCLLQTVYLQMSPVQALTHHCMWALE